MLRDASVGMTRLTSISVGVPGAAGAGRAANADSMPPSKANFIRLRNILPPALIAHQGTTPRRPDDNPQERKGQRSAITARYRHAWPPAASAARTRAGVRGTRRMRTPIASNTALPIAARTRAEAASPPPLGLSRGPAH